jgi:hypothetical protein
MPKFLSTAYSANGDPYITGVPLLERGASTAERLYGIPGTGLSAVGTRILQNNRTYYSPFYTPEVIDIDSIISEVTAGAAGSLRLGIYDADEDWQPGDLIADWGTVDTASNAVKIISLGSPTSIPIGRYVIAASCSASITVRITRGYGYSGVQATMGGANFAALLMVTGGGGGGALPDPGAAWDTWQPGGFGGEYIAMLRYTT